MIIRIFIAFILCYCSSIQLFANYSFFVAGHVYGSHAGTNIGLHPPFLDKLSSLSDTTIKYLFLTGDIVNKSNAESWTQVSEELNNIGIPSYYVMGNHDNNNIGYDVFKEKHGGTYYSFTFGSELFIVLNSTLQQRSISDEQIIFLTDELSKTSSDIKNVFVFFHEILWNSHEKYKDVLSNSRSRYGQIISYSNYWEQVHPLLKSLDKKVFVIAGDVAGNGDAIPTFYDVWDNVTLIASGMGEVPEENYLKVDVEKDTVLFELVALRDDVKIKPIEFYSLSQMPDTIYGPQVLEVGKRTQTYWVDNVLNADIYLWDLTEGIDGSSTNSSIELIFDETFLNGTVGVKAFHSGFGYSETKSIPIMVNNENEVIELPDSSNDILLSWYQTGYNLHVNIKGELHPRSQLSLFDLNGRCLQTIYLDNNNTKIAFNTFGLTSNIYLIVFTEKEKRKVYKVWLN